MDTQIDSADSASFQMLKLLRTTWKALLVILLGMSVVLIWHLFRARPERRAPDRLPVHQTIPDFQLVNQTGQPFVRQNLSSGIWVANFVFTRCPGICPLLSTQMSKLQAQLDETDQPSVRLLSFSVDPEWDTPERLSEYAEKHHADIRRWFFLTGDQGAVQQLVTQGFQLSMMNRMNPMNRKNRMNRENPMHPMDAQPEGSHADHAQQQSLEQIVHSDRFVLIDPKFRIRAYYRGNEEGLINHIMHDIDLLQHEYELVL